MSFCNLDVLPVADVIISSLTKSFSGYADLMAGSIVLNPNKSSYSTLKSIFAKTYHNEFFAGDANQLFKNSDDYLPRSAILNRNAAAVTKYFQSLAEDPNVPVAKVWYPPYADGSQNLIPFMRKPTSDFTDIGHGCLFSVEFETLDQAMVFYDNLDFHQGPHLGAHLTLAMPYCAMLYWKDSREYHASYGLHAEQIRISVGLEEESDLLERCKRAMAALAEASSHEDLTKDLLVQKFEGIADGKTDIDPISGKEAVGP